MTITALQIHRLIVYLQVQVRGVAESNGRRIVEFTRLGAKPGMRTIVDIGGGCF